MTGVSQINRVRWKFLQLSRAAKELFWAVPVPRGWFYRWLFTNDDGAVRRVGEHVLADLREFCFLDRSAFDTDPLVMARRQGRRDVGLRIIKFLNLDEAAVQKLMEIDDGI